MHPLAKRVGLFPSASLSKKFEGGERERNVTNIWLKGEPIWTWTVRRFFWACAEILSVSRVQQGRDKIFPPFYRNVEQTSSDLYGSGGSHLETGLCFYAEKLC